MKKIKILWITLTIGVGVICAYFGVRTSYALFQYWKLDRSTAAKIEEWKIIPEKNGKYSIQARYAYQIGEKSYQGVTKFTSPLFLNSESAISATRKWSEEEWLTWYNNTNISDSSLEKHFPLNLFFRFIMCLGVFTYFIWVKQRVIQVSRLD